MSSIRRHVIVTGHVQGVGFRFHTVDAAQRLGVDGWVQNLRDGTVEAEVEGDRDAVEAMLAWLQEGPPSAEVERLDVTEVEPGPAPSGRRSSSGFRIR